MLEALFFGLLVLFPKNSRLLGLAFAENFYLNTFCKQRRAVERRKEKKRVDLVSQKYIASLDSDDYRHQGKLRAPMRFPAGHSKLCLSATRHAFSALRFEPRIMNCSCTREVAGSESLLCRPKVILVDETGKGQVPDIMRKFIRSSRSLLATHLI